MTKLPFAFESYQDISRTLSSQRLVNAYLGVSPEASKTPAPVIGTPGLSLFATAGSGPIRGMTTFEGNLYVVSGSEVYRVSDLGVATKVGDVGFNGGRTPIIANDIQGCIVEINGNIYSFNSTSVTLVTDPDVRKASDVTYIDGFFVFTQRESDITFSSNLKDVTSFNALNFATVEGAPDLLVGVEAMGRQLWYFGQSSVQVYYNAGSIGFPFLPVSGALWEKGCQTRDSVAKTDNTLFWLGNDNNVYQSSNYGGQVISTPAISNAIAQYSNRTDAFGFTYDERGYKFYILSFPSEGVTWGYNITTGKWHERSTSDTNGRWRANNIVNCYGKNFVGDYESGKVFELSLNFYTDNGAEIIREATSINYIKDFNMLFFDEVLLDLDTGLATSTGQGSNPLIQLSWSDDGGNTFGNFITRSVGKIGEYQARARFQGLGAARQRVFRLRYSEPTPFRFNQAYMNIRQGKL